MDATLTERREIAQGTEQATFTLLSEEIKFLPGQYIFLTLPDLLHPDERGGRRQFSIITPPSSKHTISIATRISQSGFKKTLMELPLQSRVMLGPVAGRFTLPENTNTPLVFIAGGIGITPFMSMLRYVKEQRLPYTITLIYSNHDRASTPFLSELEGCTKEIPNFRFVASMTQDSAWQGERRRIDPVMIKEHVPDLLKPLYYVVGPPVMTDAIAKVLSELQIPLANIKRENFAGY